MESFCILSVTQKRIYAQTPQKYFAFYLNPDRASVGTLTVNTQQNKNRLKNFTSGFKQKTKKRKKKFITSEPLKLSLRFI